MGQAMVQRRFRQGDRLQQGRDRSGERVLHPPGRGRSRHAGNRRPALCHLRPRRGRRHGGGDVDGGRPPARDRQRALARPVLQDYRSEGGNRAAPDRRPRAPRRNRCPGCIGGEPATHQHPGRGGLGVRLRLLRPLLPARSGRLVETGQPAWRACRHDRRLRRRVLVSLHGQVCRHDPVDRDRRPALRHRRHGGEPDRHGRGHSAHASARCGDAADDRRDPHSEGPSLPGPDTLIGAYGKAGAKSTSPRLPMTEPQLPS